jgi:adenylate kinase family enzyme
MKRSGPSCSSAVSAGLERSLGQRILVLGPPGSGKTELSKKLRVQLGLSIIHLDREFWGPGFQKPASIDWLKKTSDFSAGKSWIMDGTYFDAIQSRIEQADSLVILDLPWWLCAMRLIGRTVRHRGKIRVDLGQPERIHLPHIVNAITYKSRKWWKIQTVINTAVEQKKAVIVLRSSRDVDLFLTAVKCRVYCPSTGLACARSK